MKFLESRSETFSEIVRIAACISNIYRYIVYLSMK